jgi:hypothetical protein
MAAVMISFVSFGGMYSRAFSSLDHLGTTPYRKSAEAIPAFFQDGRDSQKFGFVR